MKRGQFKGRLEVHQGRKEEVFRDIVRIHEDSRNGLTQGRVHKFSIQGKSTYFILRGSDDEKDRGRILMDDASRRTMGVCFQQSEDFEIVEANFFGEVYWAWNASETAYLVAAKLAVVSLVLGLLSLVLAVLPFINWVRH